MTIFWSRFTRKNNHSGFTLLEILVASAILGILLLLLIPVISRTQRRAHDSACLYNLHQIGSLLQLYVIEHNGYLPNSYHHTASGGKYWFQLLAYYGEGDLRFDIERQGNVFQCPASENRWRDGNQRFWGNYGWNISAGNQWDEVNPSPQLIRYRRDDFNAHNLPLIGDTNPGPYTDPFAIHWFSTGQTSILYLDARHQKQSAVHFLFADGSARPIARSQINMDFINASKHRLF